MAPEQALAKRVVIDHRADIYSLGATLYELLTLRPAFGDTDRSELLKRIAFEEPTALRKLDRNIPVELETIVLKAMGKAPECRVTIRLISWPKTCRHTWFNSTDRSQATEYLRSFDNMVTSSRWISCDSHIAADALVGCLGHRIFQVVLRTRTHSTSGCREYCGG